tara:strand:+ start:218 stop:577 length:360 start_codon:yes stop_codon:yes gene_type:complete
MRSFKSLTIWQEGIKIVKQSYSVLNQLPQKETFNLKSQIARSAVSIPSNIAEGCSRSSQIEFARFLEIALGSAFELETQIILLYELSYLNERQTRLLIETIQKEQKQINSLKNKLKANG